MEMFHVKPRWLFLKITCDDGTIGWGEPVVEGRAQTVEAAVKEIARYLIGQDPRDIEKHWQTIYRGSFYRNGPILTSALSGVEQALWDILGKHLNVPVWRLLGGKVRDRIRMYGWLSLEPTGDYIDLYAKTMQMIEQPHVLHAIRDNIILLRDKIDKRIDVALDFHGRCTPAMSRRIIHMIENVDIMFIEEPVLPGDVTALKQISSSTSIPIATGERLFTRWQFNDLIEQQAVAIIQPDISHCGGIFEARKIASMAEARNIAVAPHCPLGPIALASSLQLASCTPNFLCQEHLTLGHDYLKVPFQVKEGYVDVPHLPGLGIEVDEEKVRAGIFAGDWDTPQFRLKDGSFAEW
ncbi:unnamed protein product [Rotaria sordida]|uniref:Mandelate racemase/muconate lactonizing enzyme C-terminal domain-containing protein n=2 Tax=Rotaria sordida TaxID=392033 RepID=A0A815TQX3_9BILA|nr:unnamed protein product [Rotaria sordida]CAF1509407.1 unnamed protein product [Rotaria sordida]